MRTQHPAQAVGAGGLYGGQATVRRTNKNKQWRRMAKATELGSVSPHISTAAAPSHDVSDDIDASMVLMRGDGWEAQWNILLARSRSYYSVLHMYCTCSYIDLHVRVFSVLSSVFLTYRYLLFGRRRLSPPPPSPATARPSLSIAVQRRAAGACRPLGAAQCAR